MTLNDHPEPPPIDNETPPKELKITNLTSAIEALLRNPNSLFKALLEKQNLILPLILLTVFSMGLLGLVFGTYSTGHQLWAAPLKIIGGFFMAALICFPSLYIFSCLADSPLRFRGISAAYLCFLALIGLLVIAFAPILWIFTQSSNSLPFVGFLALTVWALSFAMAGKLLRKISHTMHSGRQIYLWLFLFLIVTLQMSTALRPLLGPTTTFLPQEKKFFLTHWSQSLIESSVIER